MLCNQHHIHTHYPAKNRILVSSQAKLNTSLSSLACENSLLVTQALTRGLCHVTPTARCLWRPAQYAASRFRLIPQAFLFPFYQLNVHYKTVFPHSERLKGVWVSKHDGKIETSGYWTEPISLLHCHTDRKVNNRESPTTYPKATEPEFALLISYCVLSIDAAILLSHSFHWDSLLRLSI